MRCGLDRRTWFFYQVEGIDEFYKMNRSNHYCGSGTGPKNWKWIGLDNKKMDRTLPREWQCDSEFVTNYFFLIWKSCYWIRSDPEIVREKVIKDFSHVLLPPSNLGMADKLWTRTYSTSDLHFWDFFSLLLRFSRCVLKILSNCGRAN